MNNFCGMGRLTHDPELREMETGSKVCRFSIAINRDYKNKQGEYEADFINCVAFDKRAEFIQKYFGKGSMIGVTGRVQTRKWDKDGETRYATEIIVNGVTFASEKKSASQTPAETAQSDNEFPGLEMDTNSDDLPF